MNALYAFAAGWIVCMVVTWPLAYRRGQHAAERRLDRIEDNEEWWQL